MEKLTKKEEEIMQVFWSMGRAFVKEIREQLPEPRPHVNTVSTAVRRLVDKGYLDFEDFGATYRYFPVISKEDYSREHLAPKLASVFGKSYKNVVAFFAKEEKITKEDLEEIIDMIEKKKEA